MTAARLKRVGTRPVLLDPAEVALLEIDRHGRLIAVLKSSAREVVLVRRADVGRKLGLDDLEHARQQLTLSPARIPPPPPRPAPPLPDPVIPSS